MSEKFKDFVPEAVSAPYDHPMQPDWRATSEDVFGIQDDEPLPLYLERFRDEARQVFGVLHRATRGTYAARESHERANIYKLGLSEEERAEYMALAGDPNRILDHIRWFGHMGARAYDLSNLTNLAQRWEEHRGAEELGKVTVELCGGLQAGFWDGTGRLDRAVRELPEQLARSDNAAIEVFDDPEHPKFLTHKFKPLLPFYMDKAGTRFEYGTVRRKRMLADIALAAVLENGTEVNVVIELYKESTGVILLNRLDPTTKEAVIDAYQSKDKTNELSDRKGSRPAAITGEVFEQAIRERATTDTVMPMSIQNLMTIRAPQGFVEKLQREIQKIGAERRKKALGENWEE